MKIGAALVLIAVGAILRFALVTVYSHGVYLHTVGDILMGIGVLGIILWAALWGPWTRNRSSSYRRTTQSVGSQPPAAQYPAQPGQYPAQPAQYEAQERSYEERRYEDQYPA
ncbi:MAG TPA: hypothetical protein VMR14_16605 [Streptosporangiaceae bacterium]|jgi:hypothetical protein|nr:hypothetical protein [Streptosporangiaceae bacterium]